MGAHPITPTAPDRVQSVHPRSMVAYDRIGASYRATRRPDPRIALQVHTALRQMGTVANVGAGTGSYEPPRTIVAVEPSMVMITQRPAGSAPSVAGTAEALPLRDNCIDAAMAILTVHRWRMWPAGLGDYVASPATGS
jgi:ubiquinone/menaquinone biosynthesis C-methylase UbiE